MKKIGAFLLLLFVFGSISAQSPYCLNWKTDGYLLGGSAVVLGVDLGLNLKLKGLSEANLMSLDVAQINGFDRFATSNYSAAASMRSDVLLWSTVGMAASNVFVYPALQPKGESWDQMITVGVMLAETNLLTYGLTEFVKSLTLRPEPYVYNAEVDMVTKKGVDARKSFFSGHTSLSAANGFFAARVFCDYYPESRWKPLAWALGATLPAWTGWERIQAGKHFPTDVLAGYVLGALCGYFIPHLHKKRPSNKFMAVGLVPMASPAYSGLALHLDF